VCQECTLPAREEEEEEDRMGRFTCVMRNLICNTMRHIKTPVVHVLHCVDLLMCSYSRPT
jgi:delta-aminolevulinic acid dehydratase/porphobilinogen synthase